MGKREREREEGLALTTKKVSEVRLPINRHGQTRLYLLVCARAGFGQIDTGTRVVSALAEPHVRRFSTRRSSGTIRIIGQRFASEAVAREIFLRLS